MRKRKWLGRKEGVKHLCGIWNNNHLGNDGDNGVLKKTKHLNCTWAILVPLLNPTHRRKKKLLLLLLLLLLRHRRPKEEVQWSTSLEGTVDDPNGFTTWPGNIVSTSNTSNTTSSNSKGMLPRWWCPCRKRPSFITKSPPCFVCFTCCGIGRTNVRGNGRWWTRFNTVPRCVWCPTRTTVGKRRTVATNISRCV